MVLTCFLCNAGLKDLGIESPRVFLMSSFQLHKYDFSLLQETLETELPKDKRDTLLYVMPNVNPDVISKKKKALKVHLYLLATLSAAAAAVPVPGLSVAVDVAVLIGAVTHFVHAFGLDVQSLKRLAIRTAVSYTELRDVIISPVAAKEITKELFLKVFAQLGGAAGLIGAEEVSRFIPIVGIPVAMSLSFVTTYRVLNFILNQLAEDAQKVLNKALVWAWKEKAMKLSETGIYTWNSVNQSPCTAGQLHTLKLFSSSHTYRNKHHHIIQIWTV